MLVCSLPVQGCSEIRWLAEKMHAKPTTISGLSGGPAVPAVPAPALSRCLPGPSPSPLAPPAGLLALPQPSRTLPESITPGSLPCLSC